MRDDDDGEVGLCGEKLDLFSELFTADGIEIRKRLVHEQDRGRGRECACECDALLLPSRKFMWVAFLIAFEINQAEHLLSDLRLLFFDSKGDVFLHC